MKMSDHFILPVSKIYFPYENGNGVREVPIDIIKQLHIAVHAINHHDKLVEAVRLFIAYNIATDDDDDVAMMLMYADALKAAMDAVASETGE